jgi:hypothetical protein
VSRNPKAFDVDVTSSGGSQKVPVAYQFLNEVAVLRHTQCLGKAKYHMALLIGCSNISISRQRPQSASKNQVYFHMLMNVHSKRKLYNQLQ